MQFYSVPLKANTDVILSAAGRVFLIDEIDGTASVDVTLLDGGGASRHPMPGRKVLFKCVTEFSGMILRAATDCTVKFFVSFDDVQNGYADGGNVAVPGGVKVVNSNIEAIPVKTPAGEPLEVLFTGTVEPVLGLVTIDNTDAEAIPVRLPSLATIEHPAPVVVGLAAAALVADATLRKLIIKNGHASATVAIGGAGVTLANAAILLEPGDIWVETDAAGAAWYAISDTAATSVQVMGVK
jgi:hypothetical protein